MDTSRSPIAGVSRLLYVAMALSAVFSIAVYVILAKLLIDLVQSSDIESTSSLVLLLVTLLSVPLTIGAILYTVLRARVTAALGGLATAFAGFAWNFSFGERDIALLLLVPTAMIVLIAIWLVLRKPPTRPSYVLTRPE